jgi:site-specific DNA recombinase
MSAWTHCRTIRPTHVPRRGVDDAAPSPVASERWWPSRPRDHQRDEHEHDRLARKIAALDREVQRLIDAYQAEVIDLIELTLRRGRIEEHGQVLRARLAELVNQRAEREQEIRLLEGLQAFSASVRDGLHDPSFAVKQRVLQLVVDRIVVEDSRVVVHHVVPSGPVRLQTGQFGDHSPPTSH